MNKIDEIKQAYERADEAGFWIGDVYANSQVDEWLHYLIGEVERLKEENDHLKELRLHRMEVENGGINFSISGEAGMAFAAILFKFYEDNGGKNFFSFDVEKDGKKFNITIQNLNGGISPIDKLKRMEQENEALRKALEFYADRGNYVWHEVSDDPFDFPHQKVDDDKGDIARQALGREVNHEGD